MVAPVPRRTAARRTVHAAAGKRLGASNPRQEGITDLRLVPPALAAWGTCAWALYASPGAVTGVVAGCVVLASALLLAGRARTAAGADPGRGDRRGPGGWSRVSVGAVLLCVAAAAASAGLRGADLRRGPVPELARRYATVTAEVELTSDPRLSRPRVRGDRAVPESVLIDAEVKSVTESQPTAVSAPEQVPVSASGAGPQSGPGPGPQPGPGPEPGSVPAVAATSATSATPATSRTLTTRTPVLLIVDVQADAHADVGAGRPGAGPASWLRLLPSTRLRVSARSAPPLTGGDRVAAVLRVDGGEGPRVAAGPSGPQRTAGRLRAGLREATGELAPDARALLPGLVVGDTSRITPELDEAFRATDLTHTLAVSGSNLTILLALLVGPPGLARFAERRGLAARLGVPLRGTALLGGALTVGFVVVCRPDPSVLRAAACGGVALLALATGRRRSLIPALAASVLLLVLYDPWLGRSYGFLLSVLATGALLTLAPRWSAALRARRVPDRWAEALAAAAAAQAVCAPVVAVLSARVSLVAVPCNILAEVAVAPATVLGFAALAVAPVAMPVAKWLAWCAGWPTGWIARVARTGAGLPGAGVDWPGSWTGALLLALVTVVVVCAGGRLSRHPWLCGACGLLLVLAVVRPPPLTRVITGWPPPGWRFAMCDVGQGDATVLAAGAGAGVVVDAGPDPVAVDRCLTALGITTVPLLVLTHFHADHVAGLPGVLRGRTVGAIETTDLDEPADQVAFVRRAAAARGVPLVRAVAGEQRRTGGLSWQVLWPPSRPAPVPDAGGPNDASVTLLVRTPGLQLLLLGDLEPDAQRELLMSPAGSLLGPVDVLKVAHHGSAYQDPELMRRVSPRLALVSCGADNPYGHPAPATVAALEAEGATVLRTDRDGALAVSGSGTGLRVSRS